MFNKTYKDLNTFSNVQQLIVLKNYDMVQRLELIWYDEALFYEKLLFVFLNEISTYIPFFKEKIYLFDCHKIKAGSSVDQHMINVNCFIPYFLTVRLTLFQSKKIKSAGVRIIGLLMQEPGKKDHSRNTNFLICLVYFVR